MPFPKLSQLQSRLAASMIASGILLLISLTISSPSFAYAAEVDSIRPEDHNHDRLLLFDHEEDDLELRDLTYESEFFGFDRSIIGRALDDITNLTNNEPTYTNLLQGETRNFIFTKDSLWGPLTAKVSNLPSPVRLSRRDGDSNTTGPLEGENRLILDNRNTDEETTRDLETRDVAAGSLRTLYITINTCMQPLPNTTAGPPPQLELYISTSNENQRPGPNVSTSQMVTLDGGAGSTALNVSGNVYIGVYAPNNTGFTGIYNAELAASIDAPYHNYNSSTSNLEVVDSDYGAALLVTQSLSKSPYNTTVWKEWMALRPPFVAFAHNQQASSILGVQNSYCGLQQYAQLSSARGNVQASMTDRGIGKEPKQQFYISGLNSSSSYYGIMALPPGNGSKAVVGGGGTVWQTKNFSTISDNNCQIIHNLSFCDQIAYAVPSNPKTFNSTSSLAAWYDNSTQAAYQFFDFSLQQVPCNITSSGQYSLARTCTDCAAAYKQWLCAVSMPRCTSFSNPKTWLQERNIMQPFPNGTNLVNSFKLPLQNIQYLNASRNPAIDAIVQPGPYKEVLPCADLCYDVVQSCPASLSFGCPQPGMLGYNQSYGNMPTAEEKDQMTCNYPGVVALSDGRRLGRVLDAWGLVVLVVLVVVLAG